MDRSLAGSSPLARLTRPFDAALGSRRAGARRRGRADPLGGRLGASVAELRRGARALLAHALRRRAIRLALALAAVTALVLGLGWFALRHSSLAAVRHVRVSGVHGPEAGAIEAALIDAAHRQSTLAVSSSALLAAVAPFRVVQEVRATPSFPHGMHIVVVEQLPVAALVSGGTRTAVAADGVALGPALLGSSLPTVQAPQLPATGTQISDPKLRAVLAVLGAAPAQLARLIASAGEGPRGLTVTMRNGLLVYFGDASRPHAKWFSFARVLADPSSAGAFYVDVRLPARPAAGFPPGVTPPASSSATATGEPAATQPGGKESTVGALAAGLAGNSGVSGSGPPVGAAKGEAGGGAGEAAGGREKEREATSASGEHGSGEAAASGSEQVPAAPATGGG